MLTAGKEDAPVLAFSPAYLTCPNRTATSAMNFHEVTEQLEKEARGVHLGLDTTIGDEETN